MSNFGAVKRVLNRRVGRIALDQIEFDIAAALLERRQRALGTLQPVSYVQTRIDADVPSPAFDRANEHGADAVSLVNRRTMSRDDPRSVTSIASGGARFRSGTLSVMARSAN